MAQRKIQSEQVDLGVIGDVSGPASSTDNAIPRFDGTGGKTLQESAVTIGDDGSLNVNPSSATGELNIGQYATIESRINTDTEQSTSLTSTQSVDIQLGTAGYFNVYNSAGSARFYVSNSSGNTTAVNPGTGINNVTTNGATQTLTNKRITPRVSSYTNAGSNLNVTNDNYDMYSVSAQSANITIGDSLQTPSNGERKLLRIKDNGTARTITWGSSFRAIGVSLPTTTTANKTLYIGMVYNSADTKWDILAVSQEL